MVCVEERVRVVWCVVKVLHEEDIERQGLFQVHIPTIVDTVLCKGEVRRATNESSDHGKATMLVTNIILLKQGMTTANRHLQHRQEEAVWLYW